MASSVPDLSLRPIRSAIPAATALRLCPQAVVLPVRMSYYASVSRQIRDIFFRYTPLVEPLSLDEAFLDVTGSEALFGKAEQIAHRIKQEIKSETGLTASVGIAPNKFLAKIASDLEKPDGLVVVRRDQIREFLDPLSVGRLWGVGKVTGGVFERLSVDTIGQLRRLSTETLRQHFSSQGEHFWRLAHGIDDRAVVPDRAAKSISHETTFAPDISDIEALRGSLQDLTEQVTRRLRPQKQQARTVHLKVRFADFPTITRSRTLPYSTDVTDDIWQAGGEWGRGRMGPGEWGQCILAWENCGLYGYRNWRQLAVSSNEPPLFPSNRGQGRAGPDHTACLSSAVELASQNGVKAVVCTR